MELSDIDREEIARLIVEGCTSGILDNEGDEQSKGKPFRITWKLEANKFED